MIIVMKAEFGPDSPETRQVVRTAERFPSIHAELHVIEGATRTLTEIYLLGPTTTISSEPFEEIAAVEKVIRIRERYRTIGRHEGQAEEVGFEYNGLHFSQDRFHLFPGVCAVDTRQNLEDTFRALRAVGIQTTRLILFEFFIRFLSARGRPFEPLLPPSPPSEPLPRSKS